MEVHLEGVAGEVIIGSINMKLDKIKNRKIYLRSNTENQVLDEVPHRKSLEIFLNIKHVQLVIVAVKTGCAKGTVGVDGAENGSEGGDESVGAAMEIG